MTKCKTMQAEKFLTYGLICNTTTNDMQQLNTATDKGQAHTYCGWVEHAFKHSTLP